MKPKPLRGRRLLGLWLLLPALLLAACLCSDAAAEAKRPKVGLALSGGGARGIAHIGVLAELERIGVKIDYIAGTSMGSIVGGLYAAGYTPEQMKTILEHVEWKEVFSSTPQRRLLRYDKKGDSQYLFEAGIKLDEIVLPGGILSGYKLDALLNGVCLPVANIRDFDKLTVPYRAVATDIVNGDTVILAGGSLAEAMRISMSIPGVFPPYQYQGRLLVDGGLTQNLPVETVRAMGAEVVIAVDVSTPLRNRGNLKNFIQVLDQTVAIQMIKATERQAALADLVIRPDLTAYKSGEFEKAEGILAAGTQAARSKTGALRALAANKGIPLKPYSRAGLKPVEGVVVAKVTLDGPSSFRSELRRMAPFPPGERVTVDQLDQTVQKLYGLGNAQSVSYEILPAAGGRSEVRFKVIPKDLGEVAGRLRLELGVNSERTNPTEIELAFRRQLKMIEGSQARLNVLMGRSYGGALAMVMEDRPWSGLFLRPELSYYSRLHDLYENRQIQAEYAVDTLALGLFTGQYLGTWGELSLGYLISRESVDPQIATIRVPDTSNQLAGFKASFKMDTMDRMPFPTGGLTSDLTFTRMLKDVGSDLDFSRLEWRGTMAIPLAKRHLVRPVWRAVSSFDTEPPFSQALFIGGFDGMWGYAYEEFLGQDLASVQLMYRYELTPLVYLRLAGNVGGAWMSLSDARDNWEQLYWGGGFGLGFDTPLGPLEMALGLGEAGRVNVYLSFGHNF
ncbi:MAG: patatin-like phospholipase family protein [Desulfarculus sp.]|nr:patatin-like phospholipase family protein [Pseudomonadota bacterium]MBV1717456.1 patatin-like phospholipase family protein [Desulfarculus sp.]MBU4577047.1 patatin-like phospholipase family protein [Pseudomonadota bacterium]MBU4598753.1 patatin-like phospholipase family protein [Pseudomonadota bacterium]MBV1740026.1 patatin-like phospholipase family protein [Desulfarculus sp.]